MQIRIKGELFHMHPHEEKKYGLDKDHVIIDKAAFVAVIQEVQELRSQISTMKEDGNGSSDRQ